MTLFDRLIDEVGEDEAHPLASLMEVIGVLIENMRMIGCLESSA